MDGFGLNDETYGNAIAQAEKPELDKIFEKYPGTRISACGHYVGLPDGQMGNSEVGHLNIGAGRIVYQSLSRITMAIEDGSFFDNAALIHAIEHVKENDSALHITGLLSDGGVHSHIEHIKALIDLAEKNGIKEFYVHCYLDGRDVPPRCAVQYIKELEQKLEGTHGRIATVAGRYYAMDRDKRWEREQLAYDAMTLGEGFKVSNAEAAVTDAYERDENDEFVKPTLVLDADGNAAIFDDWEFFYIDSSNVDDYETYYLNKNQHIAAEDYQKLLYRYNPDVSYETFEQFIKDFSLDYVKANAK